MDAVKPMLAEAGTEPFDSPEHLFEWKWNGIRVIGRKRGSSASLQGRSGADFTAQFPELSGLGKFIRTDVADIDGEVVCLNEKGLPEFNRIQQRYNQSDPKVIERLSKVFPAVYMVFDVIRVDEFDLTSASEARATQIQRKEILSKILEPDGVVKLSPYLDGKGIELHKKAVELEQEGVMAKTKNGLYVPGGRNKDWLKLKVPKFRDFTICGYTKGTGWREDTFGAVVLGVPENGSIRYVGEAGSGFTAQGVKEMFDRLYAIEQDNCPMLPGTKVQGLISWVQPEIVVRVKYFDITKDGKLIWPIFQSVVKG